MAAALCVASSELSRDHLPVAGGKGANLGELLRAGFDVPDGFVVTTDAYRLAHDGATRPAGARRVERSGVLVHLTPTEWGLLDMLVRSPGSLVTQRDILREVWGPQYSDQTSYLRVYVAQLRVYVAQLRRKLEERPSRPRHLLTDPGVGYRFEL